MLAKCLKFFQIHNLIILLTFLVPSGFYNLSGGIIAVIFIVWMFEKKYLLIQSKLTPNVIPVVLFFLLFMFSLTYTKDINNGVNEIGQHVGLLIIPLIFVTLNLSSSFIKKIKKYFVISTITFVLIADLYSVADILFTGISSVHVNESFYFKYFSFGLTRVFNDWHPTYVSLSLVISFIYVLELKDDFFLAFRIAAFFVIVSNVYLLNSLIGILTYIIVLLFYVYQYSKYILLLLIAFIFLIFITVPLGISKLNKISEMEIYASDKEGDKNTLNLRLAKWKTSFNIFIKHPIFGVSPGDNRKALLNGYIHNKYFFCAEKKFSPHNQYLYILTSFGVFGSLIFLWAFIVPLNIRFTRERALFTLSFSIFFLTEDILERQQGLFLWVLLYSLYLNDEKKII